MNIQNCKYIAYSTQVLYFHANKSIPRVPDVEYAIQNELYIDVVASL